MVMGNGEVRGQLEYLRVLIERTGKSLDDHIASELQVPFLPKHMREPMHAIPMIAEDGQYLRASGGGFALWSDILAGDLPAHHTTHESGGSDAIKLDDLGAPDDNSDLNSTITEHGLCPKLSGSSSDYLNGSGTWSVPPVGTGDVVGPAGAVAENIATYDGITGKLIKDSGYAASSFEVAGAVGTHEGTYNHANYDTAYGWGDHAGLYDTVGTAATEVGSHESTYNHSNYDTAYGWGDHAGLYDTVGTAATEVGSHESTYNHANYNTAYGWGDHAGLYDTVGTAATEVGTHESTYTHADIATNSAARHTQNTDTGTTGNTFTVDSDSTTGKIIVDVALGAADKSLILTNNALTDDRTITMPDATGTLPLGTGTNTKLTKWTGTNAIGDATNTDAEVSGAVSASHTQNTDTGTTGNTFSVDSDSTTGKIIIDVALGAADKALTITNAALTDDRTATFPNATGTVAYTSDIPSSFDNITEGNSKVEVVDSGSGYVSITIDGSETLRIYTNSICDTNGNELVKFTQTASAVNEITITNAATTGNPKIETTGGDTNIALDIETKGTGQINFNVNSAQQVYIVDGELGTSATNVNINGVLQIDGVQVVTSQQSAIADIVGTTGTDEDGVCRSKVNDILALLRTHGLIDT